MRTLLILAALLVLPAGSATAQDTPARDDPTGAVEGGAPRFDLPPVDAFTAMVQRPLFSPTRRGVESAVAAPVAEVASFSGSFLLTGFAADARGRSVVVLRDESTGDQMRLLVGDSINGHRVEAVGGGVLTLSGPSGTVTVPLNERLP